MAGHFKKAITLLKTDSFETLRGKLGKRYRQFRERGHYERWIMQHEARTYADLAAAKNMANKFELRPLISILMPVYNSEERYLRAAIDSVKKQVYDSWELCIADDHSTDPQVRKVLAEYSSSDRRIKVAFRDSNGHISAASNTALTLVSGDFTALMDHDDELSPLALYFVAKEINDYPKASLIYSDEDKIDGQGSRSAPFFKPDWNPELLLGVNYVNHLTVYRTGLLRQCGAFRIGYEGSQDYDLLLRVSEYCSPENIRHIPRVLYHWRAIPGSVAFASDEKPYAHDRAREAISGHLERGNVDARVSRGIGQLHRIHYRIPEPNPKVSVILLGEGQMVGMEKLLEAGGHFAHEILRTSSRETSKSVNNPATNTVSAFQSPGFNLAARNATGSILCFLDLQIDRASDNWLKTLIGHALQSETGAVGPLIVDKRGRVMHAGYVFIPGKGIVSAFRQASVKPKGRAIRLDLAQNVSAVSANCLVIAKDKFDSVNGFDEEISGAENAAVDLCLRLAETGLRTVWTPHSTLTLSSGPSVTESMAIFELQSRWPSYFCRDPYYNPNLSQQEADYSLGDAPQLEKF
ncbi:MAG: glycosyltransferase [Acidobacteriota bacterium]